MNELYFILNIYGCMYVRNYGRRDMYVEVESVLDSLTSYQRASMPIYYRPLVRDITVMLYLCKLTDYKCINDQ